MKGAVGTQERVTEPFLPLLSSYAIRMGGKGGYSETGESRRDIKK